MSESEPIIDIRPALASRAVTPATQSHTTASKSPAPVVVFDKHELSEIFRVYGRMVAAGEWRDYALDMGRERAVFAIFRRSSECPVYTIEKCPKLARRQGAFSIVNAAGLVLKRGHDLRRVLAILDKSLKLIR